jgi:Coenzyme PQQ synthesis protein D (PqqD)
MTDIEARVSIPGDVLFNEVDGESGREAVLLNLNTGKYFGLDSTGTRIWHFLVEYGSLSMAYNKMLDEYEVDAERLKTDLLRLVDQLAAHELIRLEPALKDHES